MLDGDEAPAHTLRLSSHAVVAVGVAVLATQGLVDAVTLDWVTGTAGAQLLHHTDTVEKTLLFTFLWKCRSANR